MIKTLLIVYSSFNGHYPLEIIFDTPGACEAVQESLERLADKANKLTPRQIYFRGYADTVYFIPCRPITEVE